VEIGANEQDWTWPTWLEVAGRRFDVRYAVREPTPAEFREGALSSHVWRAVSTLDETDVGAGGSTALDAVRGLAQEISSRIGANATKFSTELPISQFKMERAVRHNWNR
jgi:hypothetical protein